LKCPSMSWENYAIGDSGICASTGACVCVLRAGIGNAAKSLSVPSVGQLGPFDWPPRVGRGKSAPMMSRGGNWREKFCRRNGDDEIGHVTPLTEVLEYGSFLQEIQLGAFDRVLKLKSVNYAVD
jgi:hypothetical protein